MFCWLLLIIGICNTVGLSQKTIINNPCSDGFSGAECNIENTGSPRTVREMFEDRKMSKFTSGNRRSDASRALYMKLLQRHKATSLPESNDREATTATAAKPNAATSVNILQKDATAVTLKQAAISTNDASDLKKLKAVAMAVANAPGNPFESLSSDRLEKFGEGNEQDKSDHTDDNLDAFRFSNFEGYKANMDENKPSTTLSSPSFSEQTMEGEPTEEEIMSYCMNYESHYVHYCLKPVERAPIVERKLFHFCPSFEKHCPQRATKAKRQHNRKPHTTISLTGPSSPFATSTKHPVPCTPDCNQKIWPHCTPECKCDYIYPVVQRFCNPPPVPFFLDTCRLWYAGCPKYHRYHYTSQYFISQASKDRISPINNPVTPYGILTSNPAAPGMVGTLPLPMPAQRSKVARDAVTKSEGFRNRQKNDDDLNSSFGEHSHHKNSLHQSNSAKLESDFLTDDYIDSEDAEFHKFDQLSEAALTYRPQHPSSIYTKPGLWDANPANPHNRDHANKYWYNPKSVQADWMHGQVTWGGHWSVPAFGVGGSDGYSVAFFPSIGQFLGIEDDYDA